MKELTDKQRILVSGIAKGLTQYEAYASALPTKGKTKHGIESYVSELMQEPQAQAYLQELREQAKGEDVASLEEVLRWHTSVLRTPLRDVDDSSPLCQEYKEFEGGTSVKLASKMDSAKELCRLQGFYEPEKHELKTEFNMASVIDAIAKL